MQQLDWLAIGERLGVPVMILLFFMAGIAPLAFWCVKRLFGEDTGIVTRFMGRVGDRAVGFFDKLESRQDRAEAAAVQQQEALGRIEDLQRDSTSALRQAGVLHALALQKIGNAVGADVAPETQEICRKLGAG